MNYIKMIKEVPLWNAGYCSLYDFSKANSCEEARIEAVCKVARVCRNEKIVKTDEELYQQLLTEHNGKPSSVFEFIPAISFFNGEHSVKFGCKMMCKERNNIDYLTNLRAKINDKEYDIDKQVSDFFVFKVKVPQMIVKHILRHRMLSFQECSERTNKLREYYFPEDFRKEFGNQFDAGEWDDFCMNASQYDWDKYQKQYKLRQELTNKGTWGLAYTTLWIAGWKQDKSGWDNFFAVRTKKPAQKEIIDLANVMKQMMEE